MTVQVKSRSVTEFVFLKHSMLKIGLTGGIGSGKSTVAKVFETLGIPVYYADSAARHLMNSDPGLKEAILSEFGPEAYTDHQLNRSFLAARVFNDPQALDKLNRLVHPVTIRDAEEWMQKQNSPYTIKEAALLFESGANKGLDLVIGVSAPQPLRIKRVKERDGLSEEEVLKRISRQMNEAEKMSLCDEVILNNEQELVIPQVLALHQKFLAATK